MAKSLLFYVLFAAIGVVLYTFAHECAAQERGYIAYGGEVFSIWLPLIAWMIRSCVRDAKEVIREVGKGGAELWQKKHMCK